MKRTLPPDIDFDLFGHCVKCHKNMLITQVIAGQEVQRLSGEYRETEYLLSSGSTMKVAMCVDCKEKLENTQEEMDAITLFGLFGVYKLRKLSGSSSLGSIILIFFVFLNLLTLSF